MRPGRREGGLGCGRRWEALLPQELSGRNVAAAAPPSQLSPSLSRVAKGLGSLPGERVGGSRAHPGRCGPTRTRGPASRPGRCPRC